MVSETTEVTPPPEDPPIEIGFVSATVLGFPSRARVGVSVHQPDESPEPIAYTEPMNTPTREEFDAKLETISAKMDSRVASIESKLESFLVRIEARDDVHKERIDNLNGRLDSVSAVINDKLTTLGADVANTRTAVGSLKVTMITTGIATAIGVAGLIYMLNTGLFGAFESGKNTAVAQAETANKLEKVTDKLDAFEQRLSAQASAKSTPPSKK